MRECARFGFWIAFLVLFKSCKSDIGVLYNTKSATSDLGWTLHPEYHGWEELSGLDVDGNTIRSYQVCNIDGARTDSWARSPYIDAELSKRVYTDIEFSVMKCPDCRETFTLYYYPSSTNVASSTFPLWRENPFIKIDTVAANERFDSENTGPEGINKKTLSIGPLRQKGFYIAVQDQGACMSLMSMKLYYYYCPEVTTNLASFPKTVAGEGDASLVAVDGKCVSNSISNEVPKYYCTSNGQWKIRTGACLCYAGYMPTKSRMSCRACPIGTYKSKIGNHACSSCPSHSNANNTASTTCTCSFGYFRSNSESVEHKCTRPPSKPNNLHVHLNHTSVKLSWSSPTITGDRNDLYFSVSCRSCDSTYKMCSSCSASIDFLSDDHSHMTGTSVEIAKLAPFSYYIFMVSALNGVSLVTPKAAAQASVRVATSKNIPSKVEDVYLNRKDANSLSISWSEPQHGKGRITGFDIRAKAVSNFGPDDMIQLNVVEHSNVTLLGLLPSTTYSVQIRARSKAGVGQFSKPVFYTTLAEKPLQLASPTEEGVTFVVAGVVGGAFALLLVIAILLFMRHLKIEKLRREETRVARKLAESDSIKGLLALEGIKRVHSGVTTRKTYVDYRDPHQGVLEIANEIDCSRIKIDKVIGGGEFGEVCRGQLSDGKSSIPVAVKRLKSGASLVDHTNFLREACTMAQFDNQNIVQLKGVVTKSMPPMLVTEFMEFGSLKKYLQNKKGELTILQLLEMLKGIACGMKYLSSMNYVHRDLAARNILLNKELVCKVSDFGLSRTLKNDPHATYTTQGGKIAPRWTAPESIRFRRFTSASDVWSYGIVMWEVMSYGEKPYWDMDNNNVTDVIEDGYRLPAPLDCPKALHNLMLQCWSGDPSRRPTFQEIISQLDNLIKHPHLLKNDQATVGPTAPLLSPDSPNSLEDVSNLDEWLDMVKLGRYRTSFYTQGVNDLKTLAHLAPTDFERLGIASPAHRSRLQSGIDTLRLHLSSTFQENKFSENS